MPLRPTRASSSATRARRAARPDLEAVADVLRDVEVGEQGVVLEHDPVVALGGGQAADVPALHPHGSGVLGLQAGDDPQQGGLAAARGPQQAEELALGHPQVDVGEGGEGSETLDDTLDRQESGHRRTPALATCHYFFSDLPS